MPEKSPLRLLGEIITNCIDKVECRLGAASVSFPSINAPYNPTSKAEITLLDPDIFEATRHIVAAASQLIATVRHPAHTTSEDALSVCSTL